MVAILRVTLADIDKVAPLFDAYRVFYDQPSNVNAGRSFLADRLSQNQSILLMAVLNGDVVGFTQLYTSYSSVSMQPLYILNDLYVLPKFRGQGIGKKLLERAKELCKTNDYKGIALETATNNPAQHLYEKSGWKKGDGFLHYFWSNHKS